MARNAPEISVVIPARDEVNAIENLIHEVAAALHDKRFEVIVVDDGSTDGTTALLRDLSAKNKWLSMLRNETSTGQSSAIRKGIRNSTGALIVTLDGDGQNPPDQIPAILAPFEEQNVAWLGLVQGQRQARKDTYAKLQASKFANMIRSALLQDGVRDSGCGLKAFRREAYFELPFFDHIHRFMPAMMLREGWGVKTVPVSHRERDGGASKYNNLGRALVGVPDLLGAAWLIRRSGPPRHDLDRLRK
jgi:dolichol-phosphate mannosyltransferase